jgi:hypothetical protein
LLEFGADVLKQRTLKALVFLVSGYALLVLPGFVWPAYFDSPAGLLVFLPILSVYFFHEIGVPGLLEHNGLCGWAWCSPTALGWALLVAFWLALALLIAWGIAGLWLRISRRKKA